MLPASKRYDYVDFLRGLAILCVLLVHLSDFFDINFWPGKIQKIINDGQYGVQLFYFASAFTIMLSCSNRYEKEHNPTRNFLIRRFLELHPYTT